VTTTSTNGHARRKASACKKLTSWPAGYDLSLNRFREVEHEELVHESPAAILASLHQIEMEIAEGIKQLEEMVG